MLSLDSVHANYGHVNALRGVSLKVDDGEIVALFGANGAGKTTTLRAISQTVDVSRGEVTFDGTRLNGLAPQATAALGIAHIPAGRGIFPRMTVWQNLKMGGYGRRLPAAELASSIETVLGEFPKLKQRLRQVAGTMSGGEQQMLSIARALVSRPKLLMLDEPSHGLAPKVVQEVFVLLAGLRADGMSILLVEQYASVALSVVERGYVLDRGTVAMSGSAEELLRDRRGMATAYLGA